MTKRKAAIVPKGVFPAMVTPLTDSDNVNVPVLRQLVDYLVEAGVHGLFPLGSQGEFFALSVAEKTTVIETVVEQNNQRVPVFVGAGAITTREALDVVDIATRAGADGVSVLTPFFVSPNDEELYQHYATIAESTELPLLLYTNPGRTGVKLSVDLAARLAEIPNIVGIKDSSGDLTLSSEYIRRIPQGFGVIAGRDTLILPTLLLGGTGSIAATANVVPALVASIYDSFIDGDLDAALEAQRRLAPLRSAFELGTFPAVIKEALTMIGIPAGPARRPVGGLSQESRLALLDVLRDLDLPSPARLER